MVTGVTDLQYVALTVPDLATESAFFVETWGLVDAGESGGARYFAAAGSSHPYVLRLREGPVRKTDLIGFSAKEADLDALFEQVTASGAKIIAEPGPADGPAGGRAFRAFDPDGRAFEVIAGAAQRTVDTLAPDTGVPLRISHVVLHSPAHKDLERWYREVLGFRLSDWLGDFMVFLRCNPAHHRLAILPGPPALNHIAFDVASVDALMRGLARMTKAGIELQWGPGRHTAGNNTFTYYTTPGGNTVEYTSDLEVVDEDTWEPKVHIPGLETMDNWGTGRLLPGTKPHAEMAPDAGLWQIPA
jgi:2,3-dihydroxy-p-cumate/2,3-dihydroxybenzoate 3,4-dioxygenase